LTPICTRSFVGCGFAPDPTGSLQRSPDPLPVFRGLLLNGGDREERKGRGREERRRGEEGQGGERSSSFALGRKKKSRRLCA